MKYKIAINSQATSKLPVDYPYWGKFNDAFVNHELEPVEVANFIYLGHAYACWTKGRRSKENFIMGQHMAVDMDSGDERRSIDRLLQHDLVRMYGGLIHTTPSHTIAAPRARVIFFLSEPIVNAAGYQQAATFLANQFDGCDTVCTDASRFFYGARDCQIEMPDNILPVNHLRRLYLKWHDAQRPPQKPKREAKAQSTALQPTENYNPADTLVNRIRQAPQGARNNTLNQQAFLAGKDISNGRVRETEVVAQLLAAAQANGLTEQEALRTINSGVRAGKAKAH